MKDRLQILREKVQAYGELRQVLVIGEVLSLIDELQDRPWIPIEEAEDWEDGARVFMAAPPNGYSDTVYWGGGAILSMYMARQYLNTPPEDPSEQRDWCVTRAYPDSPPPFHIPESEAEDEGEAEKRARDALDGFGYL